MRRLDAGRVEGGTCDSVARGSDATTGRWSETIAALTLGRPLRPVQRDAIAEARILDSRQHLVVAAPTNSGKSLIGYLVLLDAVRRGRRAVLLEPLRALAQEKADELEELLGVGSPLDGIPAPTIRISTGDYRLQDELPSAGPPSTGEIIVATPERLEAILRNPAHANWASTIGAFVIDEAHLLGDSRRGPTLELLAASMLGMSAPPRVALLSATLGEPERLQEWLRPCQLVTSSHRTPLSKEVWELDLNEDADDVVSREIQALHSDSRNAVLVFVYRKASADALARKLESALRAPVFAYHSGKSAAERQRIRAAFASGESRCVVATTALALGVNLPASHVFVRDTTFYGSGKLGEAELIQILGRAGRGDARGFGAVLVRPGDDWNADELADVLRLERLPALRSSFDNSARHLKRSVDEESSVSAAGIVAACLARSGEVGLSKEELERLLTKTLAGPSLAVRVDPALRWLADPGRVLAFRDDLHRFHLTVLGTAGARSMLPLGYVSGLGQLLRDFMSLDPELRLLERWSPLDHLIVASLLSDRTPKLRRFSEELAGQIDGWFESRQSDEKSLIFGEWIMGAENASKADELFGSLGLAQPGGAAVPRAFARKRAYLAALGALVLDERSRGRSVDDIERRWRLGGLEGVEERWRDSTLWLIGGHVAIFEIRAFYHHLREYCSADLATSRQAKRVLAHGRRQAYDVLDRLKFCSPLGPLVSGIRATLATGSGARAGAGTIRALEAAGVRSLAQLALLSTEQMIALGVQRRFAKQLRAYLSRRLR